MLRSLSTTAKGLAAALFLAVPVAVEAAAGREGGVAGELGFSVTQLVGWSLALSVCRDLTAATTPGSRAARIGSAVVRAGCWLELAFATVYGLTLAATGEAFEGAFVAFLLGFLCLLVGGVTWGVALRRQGSSRVAATGLLLLAVLGLLAIVVERDPFHDVALIASYACWAVVGRGVAGRRAEDPAKVEAVA